MPKRQLLRNGVSIAEQEITEDGHPAGPLVDLLCGTCGKPFEECKCDVFAIRKEVIH